MNIADVPVTRRPVVALMATGDELVMPGETPRPIRSSRQTLWPESHVWKHRAPRPDSAHRPRHRGLADDAFSLAEGRRSDRHHRRRFGGDHDLVAPVTEALGMERAFYKIAMRPGKPLMAGKLGGSRRWSACPATRFRRWSAAMSSSFR